MAAPEEIDDTISQRPQKETSQLDNTLKFPDDIPNPRNSTYHVAFDNCQNQTTPHGMSWLRQWAIVALVCTGTLCVYVEPISF